MTDTPRTDAAAFSREFVAREIDSYDHKFVLADFARQLERDRAKLIQALVRLLRVPGYSDFARERAAHILLRDLGEEFSSDN